MTEVVTRTGFGPAAIRLPEASTSSAETPATIRGERKTPWMRRYTATLVAQDSLSVIAALAVGWGIQFGARQSAVEITRYLLFSLLLTSAWLVCSYVGGAYDLRRVSTWTREAQIVVRTALNVAGLTAIVAYLGDMPIGRPFLAVVIPACTALQLLARLAVRRAVARRRERGDWTSSILAVGSSEAVRHLIEVTSRNRLSGLTVSGACVNGVPVGEDIAPGVPVLGGVHEAARAAEHIDADAVAVAGAGMGPTSIRELGWALEGTGRHMVMAPGLTEVAGPRVHVSPVAGLPLMWVDQPQFVGVSRFVKRAVDLIGSALLLVLLTPLFLVIAAAVRLTSPGAAIYRSVRSGENGTLFTVYKFRSMYRGADGQRDALLSRNESEGAVLFKIKRDPRITRVGRTLRKFSLDELPQLINVFRGEMSLVGPRPPLPDEVQRYHAHHHRRLLVKPGLTGLWQVSGRSDLSFDEAVRLDLYYVENWSLGLDLAIIFRTVWAVLRSRGAY